jgi:hypothetical protein
MKVRNVSPLGALELVGFGVVDAGATIDVPDEFAGHAPDPRVAAAHLELAAAVAALDHTLAVELREEIIGLDPGAGLLAQVDNWQPVTKSSKPAIAEEAQP